MTPIEKSRAQECALEILRVKREAVRDDIKTAWRRRVVETHPDRNSGDDSQFQLVQDAYQVANGTATEDVIARVLDGMDPQTPHVADATSQRADPQSQPRRARIKTRMVWFDPQAEAQGSAGQTKKVEAVQVDDAAIQYVDGDDSRNATGPGQAQDVHTVQSVRQKGRRVSYIIWSAIKPGDNEVALPTGDFRIAGGKKEVALQFASAEEGAATISMPDDQRAEHFPGAQSVRVHFSHGADARPEV